MLMIEHDSMERVNNFDGEMLMVIAAMLRKQKETTMAQRERERERRGDGH